MTCPVRHVHQLEDRLNARHGHARIAGDHPQVVAAGKVWVKRGRLDHRAHSRETAHAAGHAAGYGCGTRRWPKQAGEHAEGGCLAGAVGAEESVDLTSPDLQIQVGDCEHAGRIPLGQAASLDGQALF